MWNYLINYHLGHNYIVKDFANSMVQLYLDGNYNLGGSFMLFNFDFFEKVFHGILTLHIYGSICPYGSHDH